MVKKMILIIAFISILFGCNTSTFEIFHTEKTFPTNFYEIANQGVYTETAKNESEFLQLWEKFGFEQKPQKEINWEGQVAIFLSVIESGSCPYAIKDVTITNSQMTVELSTDAKNEGCTDDATPRTFVYFIEQSQVKEVIELKLTGFNGLEPTVPFTP